MSTTAMRKVVGLLAAAAVALLGVIIPGAANAVVWDPALINPNTLSTLHIHKLTQNEENGTTPGNGLEDASVTGDPIAGVTFKLERLAYNLTTQAGWQALVADGEDAKTNLDGTFTPVERTTGADGNATFADLPVGAYLVTETETPANVTGSDPFVVTLPMTHPTELNKWMYEVHVYPKNAVSSVEKTVVDAGATAAGDRIDFTVTGDIPRVNPASGPLKKYAITDTMDGRVNTTADNVRVSLVGTAVTLEAADYVIDVTAQVVTVTFTEAGRAKIQAARWAGDADTKVKVDIKAIVAFIGDSTGTITNEAILFVNETSTEGIPSNEVTSKWGKVKIIKTGTDNADAIKYVGAEFRVHTCTVPAGTTQGASVVGGRLSDAPLTVNGQQVFTTAVDPDGNASVTIDALRANDWKNGAAHVPTTDDWYCLVETKAPVGYELQPNPIAFQVLAADVAAAPYTIDITVTDVPTGGGFKLPLTGANGVAVMIAAGTFLVLGGAALAFVNRRKRSH